MTPPEAELAAIRSSRAYRAVLAYTRLVERLAPTGTRRRAAYARGLKLAITAVRTASMVRRRRTRPGAPAAVTTSREPLVSIVIPVHGKWPVTAQCLRSFVEHPPSVPYELVVVDDASPDDTRERLSRVAGLRVVPLDVNVGFVGATNAGIAACAGEYVVMLNNDTQITDGWLEALLSRAAEPGVGLVGSKLVYPNGSLQEAGGLTFSNAGGWNFGRLDNPALPRYNVARDVDYCSGAAIMLRRDLLNEIGGLDEYFAPAYYDDVDLAFSVRERGLRVVYEPRAVVVHHEGVSHGTDETSGVKRYQEINRHKLVAKWGARLAEHYPQDSAYVQLEARRQGTKGIIVFVDDHVPRPDEDSGSVRAFALLTTLRRLGFSVIFVPVDEGDGDVWGRRLLDEGVEIFTGPESLEHFLLQLRGGVRAVIGARVTVAWPHIGLVRRVLPGVPFIFDTVDLHHLREAREATLTGAADLVARAEETRRLELGFVMAADETLVVSPVEVDILAEAVPEAVVRVVPNVHERREPGPGPGDRTGMVFVGSYVHPPNADAVRWFIESVLPLVRSEVPDAVLRLVGKDASDELLALARPGSGVEVLGWLPSLDEVYATARVSVAPLRYGAGVKGKVGEALSHGVPVVGTRIAMEGMHIEHGVNGWVADTPEELAAGVVALLRDDALWSRLSSAGREHVEDVLGEQRFERAVVEALGAVGVR